MGNVRAQPAGEVLHVDAEGTPAARFRRRGVARTHDGGRPRARHAIAGRRRCWTTSASACAPSSARNAAEDDLDDELRFHLERAAEQHEARGLSPREARRRARLEFGQMDTVKDDCRQSWGVRQLDTLRQDVTFALRLIRKHPALSAVAAVSLAIGIGLNTALFALLDATVLRRLLVDRPEQRRRRLYQRRRRLRLVRKLLSGLPGSAPRHADARRSGGLRARGGSRQGR